MRKLLPAFVLVAVLSAVVMIGSPSEAPGQKKDEVGKVEVYQAKDGWRFKVVNEEGKAIAIGTVGFDKKEDCLKTVEALKNTMAKGKVVEMKADKKTDKK